MRENICLAPLCLQFNAAGRDCPSATIKLISVLRCDILRVGTVGLLLGGGG